MTQTSAVLAELLTALRAARQGSTLVLDQATLGPTGAAALLDLFTFELQIPSFTLEEVQLPDAVTGADFTVSGHDPNLTLDLTFTDSSGEVAIEALFHAPTIAALRQDFPALPADFFSAITTAGQSASVAVPGLAGPVTFASPRYGVAGLVLPESGLMTTGISARVDGPAAWPGAAQGLAVDVQAEIGGYHVEPLTGAWTFEDVGTLLPGLGILAAIPDIIPAGHLGLRWFSLDLYRDAPQLSSISLDVADTSDPAAPLWSAAGGKIQLTDVTVTLDLNYSASGALVLAGSGSVQGNFLLGGTALSVQIPSPPTGVWSLTAYPDLSLPGLDDIGALLGYDGQQFGDLLPAQLAGVGGFTLDYLRLAVDAGTFSLLELTFAVSSSQPWTLIDHVLELRSLQIRLTVDGTATVTGMVLGVVGLPGGTDILVSFGRSTPQQQWRLDAVAAAIPLPSLGQLAQLTQGQDVAALVTAGGLDQLHFVMTNLNFGLRIGPTALTHLGLTLQLADASDPLTPALDWEIIPGVLTLTRFSFGFQVDWGATVTKRAFGAFVLNGLEFDVRFAAQTAGGVTTDGLVAEYSADGTSGTVSVKDLIASIAPGVAAGLPAGLEITLADAVLAYLGTGARQKFLFAIDISAGSSVAGLPLPPGLTAGIAKLRFVVVFADLSEQDVAFVNAMSASLELTAAAGGIPAGFAFRAELANISIGQLLAELGSAYGISQIPEPIRTLQLTTVSVSYSSGTGAFAFDLAAGFTVESAPVQVAVTITVLPTAQTSGADPHTAVTAGTQGYSATFTGQVRFAGLQFDLIFDTSDTGTDVLVADVVRTGAPVELAALVAGVSAQLAQAIPPGLVIDLEDVVFVFLKQTASQWAFGLRLGLGINLSELPVVGSKLPPDQTLALENLQVLYSHGDLTAAQTAIINPLLPPGVAKLPGTLSDGIAFDGDLRLGDQTRPLHAGVIRPAAALPATTRPGPGPGAAPPASSADPVKWLDVNKQFGIFSFDRVGVGYQDNVLRFALDASVALGPLAFSMQALSVGSPLSEFKPEFSLQGLALTFDRPPIAIGGAFLKVREQVGNRAFDSYYGQLVVQAATFSLKALGGWAPDADPASFFIYLSINVPLGGPPFLFVTGLAGGFGVNSRLVLPTIDEVSRYPLLPGIAPPEKSSPAETIKDVIPVLRDRFVPMAGQYWVAAGISFTSFEMIQARAVISVSFGVDLQIGVVGICSMTFPTGDPDPVAYVEIDVVASFTPSTGLLAVDGKLSPASYLFGGFVKLTGGFAFYAWFSGEHQGDFVVSLGGYHPAFTKPDNYPVVPRLELAFSLGPLKVLGQAYFALTPSMFMAGVRLTATFEAGPIKAWFDAGVDFLIAWAPFHYEAHAWVTIGCSVDLGLSTIGIQIGADLQIWGPAFGGEALVDLDVVSFTIAFGAPRETPPPIGWDTFAANFLPPAQPPEAPQTAQAAQAAQATQATPATPAPRLLQARQVPAARPAAMARAAAPKPVPAPAPEPVPNIVKATVTAGMISQAPGLDWILDPDQFRILTASTIPANHAQWAISAADTAELPSTPASYQRASAATSTPGAEAGLHPQAIVPPPAQMLLRLDASTVTYSGTEVWAPTLNIAPMGETNVASYHTVTLLKAGPDGRFTGYITGVTVAPQLGASNTALWGGQGQADDPNGPRLIPATLTGFAISPVPRHPDQVSDVPLQTLSYGPGHTTGFGYQAPVVDQQFTVSSAVSADGQSFTITVGGGHAVTVHDQQYVLSALTDPWVTSQRSATLAELRRLGFGTLAGDAVRLDAMAQTALTDWPSAARIGSETSA